MSSKDAVSVRIVVDVHETQSGIAAFPYLLLEGTNVHSRKRSTSRSMAKSVKRVDNDTRHPQTVAF